ncbi:diguanylate cyclase [Vibrio aquaticus]|uniref:diguanylate cyclase n=1 Tax=Vibrio aquaticus TaxID=2496559 RepID=A0A3S0V243_9VIBR|nr:diguanylate cyclase [Vibrio aquaticus]RTZ14920.1 diguanylate cyclase [Vibrio aquaticus]
MKRSYFLPHLVMTTLVFAFAFSIYYAHQYQQIKQAALTQTAKQALHQLAYSEREYGEIQRRFASIIELLSHSRSLYDYILEPSVVNKAVVEEVWSSIAVNQKWYSQFRFIDAHGVEKIQLNYVNSEQRVYRSEYLDDRQGQRYFEYAQTLKENEIGAWGIDLEESTGERAASYHPILRLITPVYVRGERSGYFVLNVDVWYLASRLNFSPNKEFRPELVDESGFYLAGDNQSKLFGNLIKERQAHNLATQHPQVWQVMQSNKSGYQVDEGELIVFNQIRLSPKQKLYLVTHFEKDEIEQLSKRDVRDLMREAMLVLLLTLVFVLPSALLVTRYRQRSLESQLARAALSGMSAIIISDRRHRVIRVNEHFTQLTALEQKDVESRNIIKLLLGEEQLEKVIAIFDHVARYQSWEGELTLLGIGDNAPVTVIVRVQSVLAKSGKVSYYITSIVDISDRKQLEERLRVLSERDALTELWNRRKFELELRRYSNLVARYPDTPTNCLALIDLDYFKRINDELGHDEGDRVIKEAARVFEHSLRETDFVARIGGEEFAIIMPNTTLTQAEMALERLRISVELDSQIPVTVSIGVTQLSADSTRCYKYADIALYESKTNGRNRLSVCTSEDDMA